MARSRNIKPGFFINERLADLDPCAQLLFIGLWTLADKEGLLEYRERKIKAQLFPYKSVDVEKFLEDLRQAEFICFYDSNEQKYIEILNWHKHQNPHKNEKESTFPKPIKNNSLCVNRENSEQDPNKSGGLEKLHLIPDSLNLIPDSLQENSKNSNRVLTPAVPFEEILTLYHECLPELPKCIKLTKTRKAHIRQRWLEDFPDIDSWKTFFGYVKDSAFLTGKVSANGRVFRATLDWMVKPENAVKIVEGKYDK